MIEEQLTLDETGLTASFERFYSDTWQTVYRALAVGIGDGDLAREAVDEAMVRAYERWRAVSTMANREGWVYRVASNWATSRLRRRRLQHHHLPAASAADDPEPGDPRLLAAVRRLPPSTATS